MWEDKQAWRELVRSHGKARMTNKLCSYPRKPFLKGPMANRISSTPEACFCPPTSLPDHPLEGLLLPGWRNKDNPLHLVPRAQWGWRKINRNRGRFLQNTLANLFIATVIGRNVFCMLELSREHKTILKSFFNTELVTNKQTIIYTSIGNSVLLFT